MGSWRDSLIDIEPYTAGEQIRAPGLIKLNTNEDPYPLPRGVQRAAAGFSADGLIRYPDPDAGAFTGAVASLLGVAGDMVIAGNGSDEVLAFAFRAFFNSGRPVLFPDVTYSFYPVWCRLFGIPFEEVPLTEGFRLRASDYDRANGGIVIANPNAPTGIAEGADFVSRLLESNPGSVVIIDEAYFGFGAPTALPLLDRYDNLFIVRTLSKSHSLAGLRLGFGCGSPELVSAVKAVKNSFNSYTVDSFAEAVGAAAVADEPLYRERAERLARARDGFTASMRGLGFTVYDSSANFVFMTHPRADAGVMYRWLKARGVLVRWFDKPQTADHLRVTIGLEEEMDALSRALGEYLGGTVKTPGRG
ncbi:MAG: aminotransferase class I/II-fold pyridoxal phosphate-dependent enzyme [Clostridiales Family XIII bacterium]|jgi:histidinol-phosphate aminotransferase|nr:aminotransferase class I/II-fold pyridoxal phosphate-dependent enzyme [Clostridiales Family XIII bacterium]